MTKSSRFALLLTALAANLAPPAAAWAQGQFGGTARAAGATRVILLSVQQALTALPPTSAQTFTYSFSPDIQTFIRSSYLGPTALRSPDTLPEGTFALRLSTSFFSLNEDVGPITYRLCPNDPPTCADNPRRALFIKLGLGLETNVGLFDSALSYGLNRWLEATLTLPVVLVDAGASQTFSENPNNPGSVAARTSPESLDAALREGRLRIGKLAFDQSDAGFRFNSGTHIGFGRVGVGLKAALSPGRIVEVALAPEVLLPSPSEEEFAGPDSAGFLFRVIGSLWLDEMLRLRSDAGYEYDPDVPELSRATWDAGMSLMSRGITVDLGFGGSKFDKAIQWTPEEAQVRLDNDTGIPEFATITAQQDTRFGTTLVDFLFGFKIAINEHIAISGAVSVPLVRDLLRPAATGTVALEAQL